jgi:hypothetical protein
MFAITQPSQSFKSGRVYLALPILNILVPQVGQIPEVAGLPFFIVIALGAFISLFFRHLTQYASMLHLLLNRKIYHFTHNVNRFEA